MEFLLNKSKAGKSVNVIQELLKLTNSIISQMMLSMRCSESGNSADGVRTLVREVTEIFGEFNISDIIWFCKNWDLQGFRKRFEDIHRRYDALLERIIRDREEVRKSKKKGRNECDQGENVDEVKDFLDMMRDVLENDNSEMQLTRNHIKALILDILTAATDTTAIALEWALAELINHPEVLKIAQEEIDQVVGKSRLAIGRDPKVWADPLEFQPERFLISDEVDNNSGPIDVRGLHYQLLPFGTGRRGCPGASLAMQELPTSLAAMIQCFDWKPAATSKTGDGVDMSERPGLTVPRAKDLECFPVARFTPTLFAT
ncbi:hypothetical protein QUC31_001411 [Theobroma cacao]